MRISFLMSDIGISGGSQVIYNIAENLSCRNHDVFIVTPGLVFRWEKKLLEHFGNNLWPQLRANASSDFNLKNKGILDGIEFYRGESLTVLSYVLSCITEAIIKKCPPSDVVIATHNFTAQAAFYLADKSSSFYFLQGFERDFYKDYFLRKIVESGYFLPVTLICNSQRLSGIMKKNFNRESVVINPGIDTAIFKPLPVEKNEKTLTIGAYCSLRPYKGWSIIKKAAASLAGKLEKKVVLKVYGDNPGSCEGIDVVWEKNIFRENLAGFYNSCDFFVNASSQESFPLPPLEAMACGCPCLTTDIGADYAQDGVNCFVISPSDPFLIEYGILQLCRNAAKRNEIALNGIKTAKKYSWDLTLKKMEILFSSKIFNGEGFYEKKDTCCR